MSVLTRANALKNRIAAAFVVVLAACLTLGMATPSSGAPLVHHHAVVHAQAASAAEASPATHPVVRTFPITCKKGFRIDLYDFPVRKNWVKLYIANRQDKSNSFTFYGSYFWANSVKQVKVVRHYRVTVTSFAYGKDANGHAIKHVVKRGRFGPC